MDREITVSLLNGDNKNIRINTGTLVSDLLSYIKKDSDEYIACRVNNEIASLSFPLKVNSSLEFITIKDYHGMEVYRRSLSFLLEKIVVKIFPERRLVIGHSLGPGYYFDLEGASLTKEDVKYIEDEMKKEVVEDKPVTRETISYTDALEYFKNTKREDKYKLISALNVSRLSIYRCDDFFEVFDMPLVSHTGVLKTFKLIYYPPGFILQFPRKSDPYEPAKFTEQRRIFEVYQENKKLGRILNADNVGSLNQIILNNQISSFIQVAEVLHAKKIIELSGEVYKKKDLIRLICIAGPSSSGKTTFSKRFAIQLRALGLNPVTISVDNYFVEREKTPLNKDGKPDYESIEALNLELFNKHINMLLEGKEITLPVYDFITGKSSLSDEKMIIDNDDIIIIEGIHCLNDRLTYLVPKEKKFKIYVSVLTQMNIDDNNRIPTTDNRIIRRMVRDYRYRGHSALRTLQMWPYVREGEEKYIFPYQNDADGYFNSALDYELSLLRHYAEPILMQVKPYDKEYANAVRLLKFLSYFLPIPSKDVPSTSIIREFVGGSSFHY